MQDVARIEPCERSVFEGKDYLACGDSKFNPSAFMNYSHDNAIEPIQRAGFLPVMVNEHNELQVLLSRAIFPNGDIFYENLSQNNEHDLERAVDIACRIPELHILDAQALDPDEIHDAIYSTHCELPK